MISGKKIKLSIIQTISLILLLLGSQTAILAVPSGSQRPWSKIEPDSIGDVNLFNGTLNMGIPLLNLGGRGETQVPLVLRLNKPWTKYFYSYVVSQVGAYSFSVNCTLDEEGGAPSLLECVDRSGYAINSTVQDPIRLMVFPRLDTTFEKASGYLPSGQGFLVELGYGPGLLTGQTMIGKSDECRYPPPPGQGQIQKSYRPVATRFYLTFTTQDGASHELVDKNTSGRFRINTSQTCGESSPDSTFSRGNTFISTDGSAMTFVSDAEIASDPVTSDYYGGNYSTGMSGILYMANGSQYRIDNGLISWIKDRNGNTTTFTYTNPAPNSNLSKKLLTATDSMGRVTTIEYDIQDIAPFGLCDRITYQGFGGENRVVRVSKTNLGNALRSGYSLQTPNQMWPATCEGICAGNYDLLNPIVPSDLWLPDGKSYKFKYNSFVEVTRVELPTDAVVEFDHDYAIAGEVNHEQSPLARIVKEKRLYKDSSGSSSLISKTKYSRISQSGSTVGSIIQTDPNDNLLSKTVSYFYGNPRFGYQPTVNQFPYGIIPWKDGREYQTDSYGSDGTTLLRRVQSISQNRSLPWWTGDQSIAPPNDPRSISTVAINFGNGQALAILKKTEYDEIGSADPAYFSHLNVKRSKGYNYKVLDLNTAQTASLETIVALFSESDLASISETDYSYDPAYKARGILGSAIETRVLNPLNPSDVLAKSQVVYDETVYFDNAYTTTNWEDPGSSLRGNVTTTRTWVKDTNTWIESHAMFDNFGNARKVWDTSGDPNRYVETQYASEYKYAYPTKTLAKGPDPSGIHGTSENSEISKSYDFNTGLVRSIIDVNGQTTMMEYNDPLYRPTRITPPMGGAATEMIYNDTPNDVWVKVRKQIDEQNWNEAVSYLDNLGRINKIRKQDAQGDVFVETKYDNYGRVERTSNPYRQGEQKLWSKPRYDNASRVIESFAPAPDGQTGASLGTVEFGISTVSGFVGNYVTGNDASGRKARSITNALGQILRVDEPTVNNSLGTLANPSKPTIYTYNVQGELIKTAQGQQSRYFMYDSFGRLIRVRQPEQTINATLNTTGNPENNNWTAGYTYDVIGNLLTVIDAKGAVITNAYDNAGRIKTRTYSDGTPQVDYYYDGKGLTQSPQFARGNLTKMASSVSETRYSEFDNFGRMLSSQQITDGQTYNFGYKYNISGGLIEETYPSGRVVKNHLASDGGLAAVSSRVVNGTFKNYASNFNYDSAGSLKSMMLGNGKWETAQYNSRLQLTQIGLGTSSTNTSLWKTEYEYGELNSDGTTVDASKNIGIIAKQTTTIPTTNFVQTYKYDELNRLTEAKETTGGTQNWKQTFNYDRYGNRTGFSQIVGNTTLTLNNINHPTIDPNTNRFTTGQGYVYDFNGNLVQDAGGRTFTFNGDDKQIQVNDAAQNVIGTYYYDGDGLRVKKVTNAETTVFVYDGGGDLVAEYSTVVSQTPTTSYLTADQLGSPRVITDKMGTVISRRDFMPFGEEIYAGVGARTENLKYSLSGTDNVRKRFTGYEKETETSLDFAEARMYQNMHGRFTAIDPLLDSADLTNPQTFNRYIYTSNNPINFTDPSGLKWIRRYNGQVDWVADDNYKLADGELDVDGDVLGVRSGPGGVDSHGNRFGVGDLIQFNSDGTRTLIQRKEEAAQIAATTGTEVRDTNTDIIETTAATINSAIATWNENNGFTPLPVQHTDVGRLIGNLLSIATGTAEMYVGGGLIVGGGGEALLTSPACGTGAGCAIPGAGLVVAAGGVAVAGHGTFTIGNTLYNAIIKGQPTSGGQSPENVERMKEGKPPIGEDGHPVELHHKNQEPNGELVPMTRTEHRGKGNYKKNHPNKGPSKIDRKRHNKERIEYWKKEAEK
jgi:RHS repeat-associated protein